MKEKENENKKGASKKKNIWKVFLINLAKSLLSICILILVGFVSYKVSYYFLSKNTTTAPSKKEEIQEILKAAKTEEISKNLIYVCNDKNQITHMMLEICNTQTNNMDYITIPTKNDYTIPTTMYRKLCTMNEEIPQIIRISKMKQYFEEEQDAYGYGLLVVEKMLGTDISYYTVLNEETYNSHYQEVKVKLSYKGSDSNEEATPTPEATGKATVQNKKVSMSISIASDAYVKQLQDIQGDEDKIVDYIKAQYDRVNSNLSMDNKLGYIKCYEELDVSLYHYWGIPGKYQGKIFQVDTKAAKNFIKQLVENQTTYTEPQDLTVTQKATATPKPTASAKPSKKKNASKKTTKKKVSSKGKAILVLNGSRIAGLAAKTQKKLEAKGYTVSKVGDYTKETLTKTKIIVKEEGQGADLVKYFKDPTVTVGMVDDGYDIEIILGTVDAND